MKILISTVFILAGTFSLVQSRILKDDTAAEELLPPRYKKCRCDDVCDSFNGGTRNVSCDEHRDVYLNCEQSVCSIKSCPPNQLFNRTTLRCEYCRPGFEVYMHDNYAYCRCAKGTLYGDGHCFPCNLDKPGGLTWRDCYCQRLVLDDNDVCRECPNGAKLHIDSCQCDDPRKFFSIQTFTCHECPGVLVEAYHPIEGENRYKCLCEKENEIFNWYSATCTKCPPDSVWVNQGTARYCRCLDDNKYVDIESNVCINYGDGNKNIEM